jgi:alpha-glucosidase
MTAPPWWRHATVYQVYVRSFADSDGDGRGDLEGIRGRLDHLGALGVDAIWLNPCYPSPQMDHGYDVADYFDIDPDYGDLATFDALVADARARGIHVLMDVVPNHCSDQHPWFLDAVKAGRGSAERQRFIFRDGRGTAGEEAPNNWRAAFGGPAWTRVLEPDGSPGQWYLHTFSRWQPDWNWQDDDVVEHFDRVLSFWFDRDVEGFRVDAIGYVGKEDGLPDADPPPPGTPESEIWALNRHTVYHRSGHAVWRHWRQVCDQYDAAHLGRSIVLVAEAYTPRRPDLLARFVGPDQFHEAFSFDLLLTPWHGGLMRAAIHDALDALGPTGSLPVWALENHDVRRAVSRYGAADATDPGSWTGSNMLYHDVPIDLALGTRRARAALGLVLALPGSVFLYQGQELGLPEVLDLPDDARQDPAFVNGGQLGRDGCRVPLPWTAATEGAHGFSGPGSDAPWLPQPAGWGALAVDAQREDAASMLALSQELLACRHDLIAEGEDIRWVMTNRGTAVAFERGAVLVVTNTGSDPLAVPDALLGGRSPFVGTAPEGANGAVVPADSTVWFR